MIVNFYSLFSFSFIFLALYWLVPPSLFELRRSVLLVSSAVFLLTISVAAVIVLLIVCGYCVLVTRIKIKRPTSFGNLFVASFVFLPLIFREFLDNNIPSNISDEAAPLLTLGIAFYSLKAFSLIMDNLNGRINSTSKDIFLCLFSYPTFGAGPIEKVETYSAKNMLTSLSMSDLGYSIYRITFGVFKIELVLKGIIQNFRSDKFGVWGKISWESLSPTDAWICVLISFSIVYINFSAYSDIAIGLSRLFGIKVRENFNYPFLAQNVQEFWRRWHMSLGNWLIEYIYLPFVRNTGKPFIAMIVAFMLVGLWHTVSVNYLLWGLTHGAALVFISWLNKNSKGQHKFSKIRRLAIYKLLAWFLTLNFVSVLSTFAMETSFLRGCQMILSLIY